MAAQRTTDRDHGTRARYVFGPRGNDRANGCRCQPCNRANNEYASFSQKRRRLNRDHGRWARPYVPVDTAAARIRQLQGDRILARSADRVADLHRAIFRLRCTCGQRFTGPSGWRDHNQALADIRGHRLEVAA